MKKEPANWSSDNTYKQGAVVWHNGSYYHAKQDVASGVLLTNSTYWENLNPTISTDIETDATSDIKTTSPKAVKTYVDNAISTAIGNIDAILDSILGV